MAFPPPSTTLQAGAAGDPLSGAVILSAGQGMKLVQSGQVITARADPGKRSVDLWVPGVLAATTLLKLKGWADPYLTVMDAYFQTPPVGSDAANNSVFKLSGATSGSLELTFNPDATEYHLNAAADYTIGTNGSNSPALWGDNGKSQPFRVSADTTIGGLALKVNDPIAGASAFRFGVSAGFDETDGITTATIPWLTDTAGNPAHVNVAAADLDSGPSSPDNVIQFDADVELSPGVDYCLVLHRITPADGMGPASATGPYTGNVVAPVTYSVLGARILAGSTAFTDPGGGALPNVRVALLGTILGVPLVGTITAEVILNGAPTAAQAGADLRVAFAV